MTFSIDKGGCNNPPLRKYVWEKPSGEQGLNHAQGIDFKRSGPQQWRAQQEGVGTCIS